MFNGEPRKEIKCRRGLRQGDLLSPLLFTLVADRLNTIIAKVSTRNLINGLKVLKNTSINNLHYADDTILFDRPKTKQAIVIKWILRTFKIWLGLKVNLEKARS